MGSGQGVRHSEIPGSTENRTRLSRLVMVACCSDNVYYAVVLGVGPQMAPDGGHLIGTLTVFHLY